MQPACLCMLVSACRRLLCLDWRRKSYPLRILISITPDLVCLHPSPVNTGKRHIQHPVQCRTILSLCVHYIYRVPDHSRVQSNMASTPGISTLVRPSSPAARAREKCGKRSSPQTRAAMVIPSGTVSESRFDVFIPIPCLFLSRNLLRCVMP